MLEEQEQTVDLREYLRTLKRRRWLVAATILTVVATTLLVSLRQTPIYQAEARVEIQPVASSSNQDTSLLESVIDPRRRFETQVELIKSEVVLKKAAEDLGLPDIDELQKALEVELITDTQIVAIRVEHERPEEAQAWTQAVAESYIDYRRERAVDQILLASEELSGRIEEVKAEITEKDKVLGDLSGAAAGARAQRDKLAAELATEEAQLNAPRASPAPPSRSRLNRIEKLRVQIAELDRKIEDYGSGGSTPKTERDTLIARLGALEAQQQSLPDAENLRRGGGDIIAPAQEPLTPIRPNPIRNTLLALVLGTMLGVGVAFLAETLDDRVRSPEEVERLVGAPVLGYIPYREEWEKVKQPFLAMTHDATSGAAEAYRNLRTNLRFVALESPLHTILVTSALAEEGKSTTAANLAVAMAQGGAKTVLVSADLRRPSAHSFFGLNGEKGIVDAITGQLPMHEALQSAGQDNFRILTDGGLPPNPTEVLASTKFAELIDEVSKASDLVVVDSPPVLGLADASTLASRVDGILLVVDPHHITRRTLTHTADQLRKAGGTILGAVINAVEAKEGYGYYYHYYYARYYAQDGKGKPNGKLPPGNLKTPKAPIKIT